MYTPNFTNPSNRFWIRRGGKPSHARAKPNTSDWQKQTEFVQSLKPNNSIVFLVLKLHISTSTDHDHCITVYLLYYVHFVWLI